MDAALRAFEEYGVQLAEVQEGLRLDPGNAALKELLAEIAANIDATEAKLAALQAGSEPAQKVSGVDGATPGVLLSDEDADAVEDEADDGLDAPDSSSEEEAGASVATERSPGVEARRAVPASSLPAPRWVPQAERSDEGEGEGEGEGVAHVWRVSVPPAAAAGGAFGAWERFTRGIGSRLLARMGYRPGGGLGARGDGVVAPLGEGAAPRGTRGLGYEKRRKRRRRSGARATPGGAGSKAARGGEAPAAATTFDFLNRTLNSGRAVSGSEEGDLRKRMLAEQERKLALDRQVARLHASLERNKKDAALAAVLRAQLAAVSAQSAQAALRQAAAGSKLREEAERRRGFKF